MSSCLFGEAFWGNGLAASCTLQTPLPGGRSCTIRTEAEPYSLNCRIPSRRVLLENRASGIRASRKLEAPALASLQMKGVGGHQGLKKLIKKDPLAYIAQPL